MISNSELILNPDGSIFHLHLKPENIADKVILVGDQGRVKTIASFFESIEFTGQNREFRTVTGTYKGGRFSVISTGIGTDNIDIVLNELDALVNIDLKSRIIKHEKKSLSIIRIGTSGSLQRNLPVNSFVIAQKVIGFDGMLNFYANREDVCDLQMEKEFKNFMSWDESFPTPYIVDCSNELVNKFDDKDFIKEVTISAPGFYGPQGRVLRLPIAKPDINIQLERFSYNGYRIVNYEMETSAIYGLSKMMGHEALTVCLLINNRQAGKTNNKYHHEMNKLIEKVLNCLIK
ncbi:MAG TPA: nucleoside phosphorylase [Mariniphaga sp.]|nr:nucleoside phosphorylase [Mariniphaga sp.]